MPMRCGMRPESGPRSLPRWPYLLALLVALGALVVRYTLLANPASGSPIQVVRGITSQHTAFELGLQRGRIRWLRTSLTAHCAGGTSWTASWTPVNGVQVHVIRAGRSFVAVERDAPGFPGGIVGRAGFALSGTITGSGSAEGTVRLVARFYRGERQWNACDSLDVPWAVGPDAATGILDVAVGHQVGEYYPAVPSLASAVSPARQRFIGRVDSVCTATYNRGARAQKQADRLYGYFDARAFLESAYYVEWHEWQLRSLMALGQPPQARALYNAWLSNFRQRVSIERRGLSLYRDKDQAGISRVLKVLPSLKTRGNLYGQRFGLVRCTSNGDRTPVPILSDGQPLPLL